MLNWTCLEGLTLWKVRLYDDQRGNLFGELQFGYERFDEAIWV